MKTSLCIVFISILIVLLSACQPDWVDDCSIPQEAIDNPPADAVAYTFNNQSCITISTLYIAPRKCDYWGVSWLGKDVLWPGESYTVYLPKGRYDLHLEDAAGVEYFQYNQKIVEGGVFPIANADGSSMAECQASVTIVNQSSQMITGFYIDRNGGKNWLGDASIASDDSFQFLMFPAVIDVKVTVGEFEEIYLQNDVVVDDHLTIVVTGD